MPGHPWPDDVRAHAVERLAAGASLPTVVRETGVPKSTLKGWRDAATPGPPGAAALAATARTEAATRASVAERRRVIDETLESAVTQLTYLFVGATAIESDLMAVQRRINASAKAGRRPAKADLDARAAMTGGVEVRDWTRMRSAAARDLLAVRKALGGDDTDGPSGPPVLVFATASTREVNRRPQHVFTLGPDNKLVDYDGPDPFDGR